MHNVYSTIVLYNKCKKYSFTPIVPSQGRKHLVQWPHSVSHLNVTGSLQIFHLLDLLVELLVDRPHHEV
jgi:hypothetical protein